MLRTKIRIATVLFLAVGIVVGLLAQNPRNTAAAQQPAPERGAPRADLHGTVKGVDATKNTLTIAVMDGRQGGGEKTFEMAKNVEVAVNEGSGRRVLFREGKLTDLTPGTLVTVTLSADHKTVETILAEGPTVRGILKGVDVAKNSVTVTMPMGREQAAEEKTYTLGKRAEIAIDDGRGRTFSLKEGKLTDLTAGAPVSLRLSADQKHVQSIVAEGPVVTGIVKGLDAANHKITLTLRAARGDEQGEDKIFEVGKEAEVLVDDGRGRRFSLKEGKLADLTVGCLAMLRLSVDQKTVMHIRADGPTIAGLVKSVDAGKNAITVTLRPGRDNPGEDKTFTLAKDARIVVDGKEGKLADIKIEDNGTFAMLRLSMDQQVVQSIIVGRGR